VCSSDLLLAGTVWFAHGKTIVAGLAGGYLGVEVAKWVLDVRTKTGDSFVVPVAVSIGIGRWGCFVAGCCFGTACAMPWGVSFPLSPSGEEVLRHPTQIYESIFHVSCAITFFVLWQQRIWPGQLFKIYLIAYLTYRFLTEWIRPEPHMLWGLTAYQWGAIGLLPILLLLLWRDMQATPLEAFDERTPAEPNN